MTRSMHRRSFFQSSGTGLAGAAALGVSAVGGLPERSAPAATQLPIDAAPLATVGTGLIDSR